LALVLAIIALETHRRQRRATTVLLVARLLNVLTFGSMTIHWLALLRRLPGTLILGFARSFFLLLTSLPFFANFLEFCQSRQCESSCALLEG
jgi:hypothetical protein